MSRFAIIASRFNSLIVKQLVEGAEQALLQHEIPLSNIDTFWVPGALEISITAQRAARTRKYDALICLGAVIKGYTDHYEHVSREVHSGVSRVSLDASLPITMGVLTVENMAQALERAGGTCGNIGSNAALAALDTLKTLSQLESNQ
ncbi:MAG: 6,7-dimethyl-8-ribityllumazine synthase [Myxococcaceae bacterium]